MAGAQELTSRHTKRRPARYRTGAAGRVGHLKRRCGVGGSRLKGAEGEQIWTEGRILPFNTDTIAIRTR